MPGDPIEPPFYPIIYVRGYAGTDDEVEDTVSDPYMGFNLGSTRHRQKWSGELSRYYFESPLVRLMKDYQYRDVYSAGLDMTLDRPIKPRAHLHVTHVGCRELVESLNRNTHNSPS